MTMPSQFNVLAQYNSEKARGLLHTDEWVASMARLQHDFDTWLHPYAEPPADISWATFEPVSPRWRPLFKRRRSA